MKTVLIDTGAIVATLDRRERFHPSCVEAIADNTSPLVTCEAVIAESCYLLRNLPGAADAVLANLEAGNFQIPLSLEDMAGPVRSIMRKYQDGGIDLADACLIHLATELKAAEILTLDRDFEHYRWGRNNPFRILLPLDRA